VISIIEEGSLRAGQEGFALSMRLPWYRSLPLSCIEHLEVVVDGVPVDPDAMSLVLNGRELALAEIADLVEEYWFIQDSAILKAAVPDRVKKGSKHQIDAVLAFRCPYIPVGPGKFLVRVSKYSGYQTAS